MDTTPNVFPSRPPGFATQAFAATLLERTKWILDTLPIGEYIGIVNLAPPLSQLEILHITPRQASRLSQVLMCLGLFVCFSLPQVSCWEIVCQKDNLDNDQTRGKRQKEKYKNTFPASVSRGECHVDN